MSQNQEMSGLQAVGLILFVFGAGFPGASMAGFFGGPWFDLPTGLLIAAAGGAIDGALLAPTHRVAGLIGGLVAGPLGLLALAYYAKGREKIWNVELVIVQGLA